MLDADLCKVDVVAQGEVLVEQDGRQARLHGGDFAFVDLSRPAHWTNGWSTRMVAIAFPRRLLPLRADDLTGLTGVGVHGGAGTGAVFSSTVRQLARQVDHLDPAAGARVGAAALDLLTVALADRLDRPEQVPAGSSQRALLLRVHAFIEGGLADPGLTPAAVARAHHVSLRSLYKLFDQEQDQRGRPDRERRLERCRHDLLDPALAVPAGERDRRPLGADQHLPLQPRLPGRLRRVAGRVPPAGQWRTDRTRPARALVPQKMEQGHVTADEVGGAFGHSDGGGVGVAPRRGRHRRGVHHPQAGHATHPQLGVAYGLGGAAHCAGPGRVEHGAGGGPDPVPDPVVVVDLLTGHELPVGDARQRLPGGDLPGNPDPGDQHLQVVLGGEGGGIDHWPGRGGWPRPG